MTATPSPRRRFFWSVRVRILAAILAVAALGMAAAGAVAYFAQRERMIAAVDERLDGVVTGVRTIAFGSTPVEGEAEAEPSSGEEVVTADPNLTTTEALLRAVMQRLVLHVNESSLALLDGAVRFVPAADRQLALEDDPALLQRFLDEAADGEVKIGTATTAEGQALRYVIIPVQLAGDPAVGLFISAIDLDAELEPLNGVVGTYLLAAGAALLVVGGVGWFVAGRLLRPVRVLRTTAARISLSDLSERIPVHGRDDVSELTRTVNGMFDRLDRAVTAQRHLLDDVRHELSTPLTIVHGHLELLDASDVDEVAATRRLALEELERMQRLIGDIELLAGAGRSVIDTRPVDVAELTAQVFAKARVIPEREWVLTGSTELVLPLDPERITQAWLQLAGNAAKYSAPGTRIELGSAVSEGALELWVADHGPGIPEEARERIFERFGRAAPGRGVQGSGLGLPIVRTIARAHGGEVLLESILGIGSRFTIHLPREAAVLVAARGLSVPAREETGRDVVPDSALTTDPEERRP